MYMDACMCQGSKLWLETINKYIQSNFTQGFNTSPQIRITWLVSSWGHSMRVPPINLVAGNANKEQSAISSNGTAGYKHSLPTGSYSAKQTPPQE